MHASLLPLFRVDSARQRELRRIVVGIFCAIASVAWPLNAATVWALVAFSEPARDWPALSWEHFLPNINLLTG